MESPHHRTTTTQSNTRIMYSLCMTLILSIIGSSVLPVPFAFSRMSVVSGVITMLVVAYSNTVTSILLLRAAHKTGRYTYEGVAEAIGGPIWKVLSQVSLMLLLFGTIVGDFALLADVGERALRRLVDNPPPILVDYDGRGIMSLLAVVAVLPLCLMRRMRSLETAAAAGVGMIIILCIIFVVQAARAGFPGIVSGDVPLWTFKVTRDLPEAFAVLGFAFYLQPVLMPVLKEVPRGERGVSLVSAAVYIVVLGVAVAVYGVVGIFGAARYGAATQGNILVNHWLGGVAEGALDLAMSAYLSISIPPMQMSCRCTLDVLLAGEHAPFSRARHLAETLVIIFGSLAVALLFPNAAEKIFAITGASAVCIVCYVIPVALHLMLYRSPGGYWQGAGASDTDLVEEALLDPTGYQGDLNAGVKSALDEQGLPAEQRRTRICTCLTEVVVPVCIVVLGVGLSAAALGVSVADMRRQG